MVLPVNSALMNRIGLENVAALKLTMLNFAALKLTVFEKAAEAKSAPLMNTAEAKSAPLENTAEAKLLAENLAWLKLA